MINKKLTYCDLDTIDYKEAWDLQKSIFELRYQQKVDDVFLLLEHPHTYTLGKTADEKNLVGNEEYLNKNKISVYDIDRGGDITYHGPGQIVGYPILNLAHFKKDIHWYLRTLEELIINTLAQLGLKAQRNKGLTGVWINNRKICAIGIKTSRWVTMHGFALNVNTNLDYFNLIVPCGISDKGVTSISHELGNTIEQNNVINILISQFQDIFQVNIDFFVIP